MGKNSRPTWEYYRIFNFWMKVCNAFKASNIHDYSPIPYHAILQVRWQQGLPPASIICSSCDVIPVVSCLLHICFYGPLPFALWSLRLSLCRLIRFKALFIRGGGGSKYQTSTTIIQFTSSWNFIRVVTLQCKDYLWG